MGGHENIKFEDVKIGMKLKAITKILEDNYPLIKFIKAESIGDGHGKIRHLLW